VEILIIGGAGKMGRWFSKFFVRQGHIVFLSDIRLEEVKTIAASMGIEHIKDSYESIKKADLVLVAAPIEETPKILQEISGYVKNSSWIMEISSVKSKVTPILKNITRMGVKVLSLHPLFGPGVEEIKNKKMVLVPISKEESELQYVKSLFPKMEIIIASAKEHDKAMALTLSLTHFLNMTFASIVSNEDIKTLKKFGGTTFSLQMLLSEAVMTEDPKLYSSIQMRNEYTQLYLERYFSEVKILKELIFNKDFKKFSSFYNTIRGALEKDKEFTKAYDRLYAALRKM
jgi:prephenate dehydrogenase